MATTQQTPTHLIALSGDALTAFVPRTGEPGDDWRAVNTALDAEEKAARCSFHDVAIYEVWLSQDEVEDAGSDRLVFTVGARTGDLPDGARYAYGQPDRLFRRVWQSPEASELAASYRHTDTADQEYVA